MMFPIRVTLTLSMALASGCAIAGNVAPAPGYAVTGRIAGPDGGWDYAKVDPTTHKLYVARATNVMVVDTANGNAVTAVGDVAKAHAVVPIPDRGILLVTSAHDDSVRLFDIKDGHELTRITVGSDPDAAFYDATRGEAVVMNAKAGTVSVIDMESRSIARTITLKPGLEYGVLGAGDTLFVNNEDENEIETADLATGASGAPIALTGCTGPTGLGYDAKTGLLISACANGKAAIVDARSHSLVRLLDIGQGPDAVIVDEARRLAFIPCGRDGTLAVIALDGAGGPAVVSTAKTATGARTGALDPADGKLYLPAADFGAPAAPGARPAAIAGSFHIVVVSPQ